MTDTLRDVAGLAGTALDIEQIKKLLPHRAPMLLVERLTDIVKLESATGWKAVRTSSSNPLGSIPSAWRAPGASWGSFPMRAIALSAASILEELMDSFRQRRS